MAEHDHKHADEELPPPGSLQDHAVKAEKVHPRPANRRRIGIALGLIGLVVVLNTVGNIIGVNVANSHSNSIVHNGEVKSHQRDRERDQLEAQLGQANKRIDTLVEQVHAQQVGDDKAICTLLVGSLKQSKLTGQLTPTGIKLVKPLLAQLRCVVPIGLLA